MANLKEIRSRISSVSSTMQITQAMKMVSAAKLKRAQDAITQMRPYANKLKELLSNLSDSTEDTQSGVYLEEREVIKSVLIVAITSNRGLAGAFNANVIKKTTQLIEEYSGKSVTVVTIGKAAKDHFRKTEFIIKGTALPRNMEVIYDDLTFDNVAAYAQKFMDSFAYKQFDKVELVYNRFVNAATQIVQVEQFLPLLPEKDENTTDKSHVKYIFEPSKEYIITELIPKSIKIQLYKAILDSHAAEHGARMTAMHKATDNATELLGELKLAYNKARQASITNEILEIVGGAEALNS